MSAQSVLNAGRSAHLQLMLDGCEITRGGERTWDPETGAYTDLPPAVVYTGQCRVKPASVGDDADAGEQLVALRRYTVELPYDAPAPVEVGDVFTTTATSDPWLPGVPLTVVAVELGTSRTARWITVEDQRERPR